MADLTYRERYALASDRIALEKLAVAVANVARDVYAENSTIPQHILRMKLVAHAGPEFDHFKRFVPGMAFLVFALNPTLDKDSSDQDYYGAVEALWTPYAKLMEARGTISAT